jgi:hypothetical protein
MIGYLNNMNQIVPPRFLFRFSFPAKKIENLPRRSGRLLDLADECLLPSLGELDQKTDFAKVKLAWNDGGIAISVEVSGRTRKPEVPQSENLRMDGIWLWMDTRNTQTVHRATRFSHHFILHPLGAGAKRDEVIVRALPVARAREEKALPNTSLVKTYSEISQTGYLLEAWFPQDVFVGFDPESHGQMGFHYMIHDAELGDQTLAVGNEFPFESDPSLWQTVELNGK